MPETITIKDVGPIARLEIQVPEGGGVCLLRGANGVGKTQAIEATQRLLGGKNKPAARDGAPKGTITGLGARINVGSRVTSSGALEVESLEGRFDLAALVDPGIADSISADARRIKALVALLDVEADESLFTAIAGDLSSLGVQPTDDLVELAGRVKRALEAQARTAKTRADKLTAEANAHDAEAPAVAGHIERDGAKLDAALEDAITRNASLKAEDAANHDTQGRVCAAKVKLAALPDVDVQAAQVAEGMAEGAHQQALTDCEALEAKLTLAREHTLKMRGELMRANDATTEALSRQTEREAVEAIVAEGAPPTILPSLLDAAAVAIVTAREAVELGTEARRAELLRALSAAARAKAKVATKEAQTLRDEAQAAEGVLSDVVATLDLGLEVRGGQLCTKTDRGMTPFGELSDGERWRLAIDLGVSRVGEGGVLAICQEAYEGLDDSNRRTINDHAKLRSVTILTATADFGELRAECFASAGN